MRKWLTDTLVLAAATVTLYLGVGVFNMGYDQYFTLPGQSFYLDVSDLVSRGVNLGVMLSSTILSVLVCISIGSQFQIKALLKTPVIVVVAYASVLPGLFYEHGFGREVMYICILFAASIAYVLMARDIVGPSDEGHTRRYALSAINAFLVVIFFCYYYGRVTARGQSVFYVLEDKKQVVLRIKGDLVTAAPLVSSNSVAQRYFFYDVKELTNGLVLRRLGPITLGEHLQGLSD
jgi:hypothetical protein